MEGKAKRSTLFGDNEQVCIAVCELFSSREASILEAVRKAPEKEQLNRLWEEVFTTYQQAIPNISPLWCDVDYLAEYIKSDIILMNGIDCQFHVGEKYSLRALSEGYEAQNNDRYNAFSKKYKEIYEHLFV